MIDNRKSRFKKAGVSSGVFLFAVIAICMMMFIADESNVVTNVPSKSWHLIAVAGEGDPGGGAGGIIEIFFVNYTAFSGMRPTSNSSAVMEGWSATRGYAGWNNTDDFRQELKHTLKWYIIVRVRGNETQCKRGANFFDADLRVRWTSADLGIGADTVMERVVTGNNSAWPYLYVNFYDDNAGAGFSIAKDATAQITSIKFEAYY